MAQNTLLRFVIDSFLYPPFYHVEPVSNILPDIQSVKQTRVAMLFIDLLLMSWIYLQSSQFVPAYCTVHWHSPPPPLFSNVHHSDKDRWSRNPLKFKKNLKEKKHSNLIGLFIVHISDYPFESFTRYRTIRT